MDICVQFNGWADCEACCGPCSSCTSMTAISTTPPHDEANCKSRAAAVCSASITPGGGPTNYGTQQEYNPYDQFSNTGEEGCTHDGDCHKGQSCVNSVCVDGGIKRPPMKRTVQLRESELVNLIKRVIKEKAGGGCSCGIPACKAITNLNDCVKCCKENNRDAGRPGMNKVTTKGSGGRDKSMSAMEVKETETSNCSCCRKNIREIPGGLHIPSCCQGCEDEGGQLPILLPGGMVSNEPGTKEDIRENHLSRRVINEQLLCDPTSMCQKDCSVLVPQSWFTMADTKPCNWVNNRFNAFNARHISMLEDGMCTTCQYKRVMCKYTYLRDLKIQNGC